MTRYKLVAPTDMGKYLANKALLDPEFNLWVKELRLSGYDPIVQLNLKEGDGSQSYRFFVVYLEKVSAALGANSYFVAMGTHKEFYEVWWSTEGTPAYYSRLSHHPPKNSRKSKDLSEVIDIVTEVLRNGHCESTEAGS